MQSAGINSRTAYLRTLLMVLILLAATQSAHAYFYAGGDWGGQNLSLLDGDTLSGTFSNVGQFYIPSGAHITGKAGNLIISAGNVHIDGQLTGLLSPGFKLEVNSLTDLILKGSLGSWKSIWLTANRSIELSGTITLLDGQTFSAIVPSPTPINIVTPIPAAAWLLGSGLLGLAGLRRKQKS